MPDEGTLAETMKPALVLRFRLVREWLLIWIESVS